jgi:hypothetical protein
MPGQDMRTQGGNCSGWFVLEKGGAAGRLTGGPWTTRNPDLSVPVHLHFDLQGLHPTHFAEPWLNILLD